MRIKHLISTIFLLVLLTNHGLADGVMYSGEPAFNKLAPSVAATNLFAQAPTRIMQQTNLTSHIAGSNQYYSHYQMNPVTTQGFMTQYGTIEDVKNGGGFGGTPNGSHLTIHGRGISFGGIFWPLELMTATNQQGQQVYYNKIDIYSLQYQSGQLFPLKVGNDLKFFFARTHIRRIDDKTTTINDNGTMEFKVVAEQQGYRYTKNKVPGNVYTIQIWESTNLHPQYYLTDIYDYSEALGWYIEDNYYNQNNQRLITYRLNNWH